MDKLKRDLDEKYRRAFPDEIHEAMEEEQSAGLTSDPISMVTFLSPMESVGSGKLGFHHRRGTESKLSGAQNSRGLSIK